MRELVVRWTPFACCILLAAGCGDRARSGSRTARSAATGTPGAPAQIVTDIHLGSTPVGSSPHGFIASGATAFFAADDGSSGHELWRTQGAPGDLQLVADLRPGGGSSLPAAEPIEGVAWNGGLLFAADDGSRGAELWFTDGTAAGTALVKDLEPGTGSSSPRRFVAAGGRVFFAATTTGAGEELWVTDGTPGNTARVLDIGQGFGGIDPAASSAPQDLTAVGATLFFTADDGTTGRELWRSDGTPGGTRIVQDISTGSDAPAKLTALGDLLYFVDAEPATGALVVWSTDGAPDAAAPLGTAPRPTDPDHLTTYQGALYFAAGPADAREVWGWDGSAFHQVTELGRTPSGAGALAAAGPFLYASLCAAGVSPCSEGARALYRFAPQTGWVRIQTQAGVAIASPTLLTDVGGVLFCAGASTGSPTLWRTDGSQAGTGQVLQTLFVREIAALSGRAVVAAEGELSPAGQEPWIVDAGGASPLGDVRPNTGSSSPQALTASSGRLFFSADDGTGRQLWLVNPASGLTALPVTDLMSNVGSFSDPADLVHAGAALIFTANGFAQGRELRAWPSTDPTLLVTDLNGGATGSISAPGGWLTALGGDVLFVGDDGSGIGRELWRTDGTTATLVQDLFPGLPGSGPEQLVAIGPNVWFVAQDGGAGGGTTQAKAFRTDGTAVVPVQLLGNVPGEFVVNPSWFAPFGGSVVFSAENNTQNLGRALFVWDAGTGVVRAVTAFGAPPAGTADPVGFTTLGAAGYFGVRDAAGRGYALWRTSDGFDSGTTRVRDIGTLGGGRFSSPIAFADRLWFVGNDDVNGDELWLSDGTAAGTGRVLDVLPGSGSGLDGSVLFPLAARGQVIFAADDGATGRELWISDGTALGTRLLHDIRVGPGSSNPADFTAVGELVFFTADDGSRGRELWVVDTSAASLDLTPPVPVCPAQTQVYEATSPLGADPALAISVTDPGGVGTVAVSFTRPGSGYYPLNVATQVTATATDGAGNRAQCTLRVFVEDTTAPALTCPAGFSLEARSPAGADAAFAGTTAAQAVDVVTASPTITYAPASGSTFALGASRSPGTTPVTVAAFDAAGNGTTCTFGVTVVDSTPPALTCPADVTVEAVDPSGATTGFGSATATDAVSAAGSITIAYDATRFGTVFPLGDTTVHATGRDEAGNTGACGFAVHVVDTTPPAVACPPSFAVEATDFAGAVGTFAATATDTVRTAPTIGYGLGVDPTGAATWAVGQAVSARFPYGSTTVGARAWDGFSFSPTCRFVVTVRDTTPPAVACPAPVVVEATGPAGAGVVLSGRATATDLATASPAVEYAVLAATVSAQDWLAPLGATTVTATATDRGGNQAACDLRVTVRDTTAPGLACPADLTVEAATAAGAAVVFASTTAATATDAVTLSPAVAYAPASGSLFPVGAGGAPLASTVNVTATDLAGNPASCQFRVTVADTRPPVASCPADLEYEANAPGGITLLAFTDPSFVETGATGVDAVTPAAQMTAASGLVTYSPALGSAFPVGTTTVTAAVRDQALNPGTCTFQVRVKDTTPPRITCPAAVPPVEATGDGAAAVSFDVTAVDSVTPAPALEYSSDPGHAFPVGVTTVTVTARDDAGNPSSCTLQVSVVDTTPPTLVCPADRTVPGDGGVEVRFPAPTVYDAGTPSPAVTATHRSGDAFPVGATRVTFTATDAAGNVATCAMTVTVHPTPFQGSAGGCATGSGGAVALLGLGAALLRRRGLRRRA